MSSSSWSQHYINFNIYSTVDLQSNEPLFNLYIVAGYGLFLINIFKMKQELS